MANIDPRPRRHHQTTIQTVLISDIVASTCALARIGTAAWSDVIEHHAESVDAVAKRHHGRVAGFTGDGFLVLFEKPADGVACALRLQIAMDTQREVLVRIGVDSGPIAQLDGGNFVGLCIHLASRLCNMSAPGEATVSERAYEQARIEVALPVLERREATVRGLEVKQSVRVSGRPREPWLR